MGDIQMSPAKKGLEHHGSVLTDEKLNSIREYLKMGLSQSEIADMLNVSQPTISRIQRNKTYVIEPKEEPNKNNGEDVVDNAEQGGTDDEAGSTVDSDTVSDG